MKFEMNGRVNYLVTHHLRYWARAQPDSGKTDYNI